MHTLRGIAVVLLLAGSSIHPQAARGLPPVTDPGDPIDPIDPDPLGCVSDDDCDDGNPCNGSEQCLGGTRFGRGIPMRCNDGDPCTQDSCNPSVGCEHAPIACPTTTTTLPEEPTTTTEPPIPSTTVTSTSTTVATSSTTSTTTSSTSSTSTTSTTRPHDGCGAAVPGCDDADPCTTDACGAGGCTHDERPGLGYVACVLDERLSPLLRDAQTAATSGRARLLTKLAIARERKVSALLAKVIGGEASPRRLARSARMIASLARMIERGRAQLGVAPADAIGGELAVVGVRLGNEIDARAGR